LIGKIHLPETVANTTFGGMQRNRLYIGASTSLYAVYTSVHLTSQGAGQRKRADRCPLIRAYLVGGLFANEKPGCALVAGRPERINAVATPLHIGDPIRCADAACRLAGHTTPLAPESRASLARDINGK
jgi:hypothetical protein